MMRAKNPDSVNGEPTIDELLRMADVASELRKQREEAGKELDFHETKEDLTKRLLGISERTGEKLTEEEAAAAIDAHFKGLYVFEEPGKNFSYRLAELYADRTRIWKSRILPGIKVSIAGGLLFLGSWAGLAIHANVQERKVEQAVQQEYQRRGMLQREVGNLELRANDIPQLIEIVQGSERSLESTDNFFNRFCSDGTSADDITKENYGDAKRQLKPVKQVLTAVEGGIEKGAGVIKFQGEVVSTRQNLDSLIRDIWQSNPPNPFLNRAQTLYQNGLASLDAGQLEKGKTYAQELTEVKTDVQQWPVLQSQPEQFYSSIMAAAKENKAQEEAVRLYNESQSYIEHVDVPHLRQTIGSLQGLDTVLKQEYEIRIVSREGVKSGIDRYFTDNKGRRVSGYYIIVEAIGPGKNALEKQITNEEDGKTYTVTMWGERVPESVYERVEDDKLDDGIIQKSSVGRKQIGYLTEQFTMKGPDGKPLKSTGRITGW